MHWTPLIQKLVADHHPKQNIVVHHVLLKWMLANGFKIKKVHRAPQFNEKPYMKKFVNTFLSKHSEAKKKTEKETFIFILNSAFNEMYVSERCRSHCDIVTNPKEYARIITDVNIKSLTIIDSNMVLLHRRKEKYIFV